MILFETYRGVKAILMLFNYDFEEQKNFFQYICFSKLY